MDTSDGDIDASLWSGDILLAIDGEPHTENAVQRALQLASALERRIVALHVKDPYLKQFYNEIYAQGRQAYLDHVDACLEEIAVDTSAAFERAVENSGVAWTYKVRHGNPAEELLDELRDGDYGLVIVGAPITKGSRRKRKSGLAQRVAAKASDTPILIVPGESPK